MRPDRVSECRLTKQHRRNLSPSQPAPQSQTSTAPSLALRSPPAASLRAKSRPCSGPRTTTDSPVSRLLHFADAICSATSAIALASFRQPQTRETVKPSIVRPQEKQPVRHAPPGDCEPDEFRLAPTAPLFLGHAAAPHLSRTLRALTPRPAGSAFPVALPSRPCHPFRQSTERPSKPASRYRDSAMADSRRPAPPQICGAGMKDRRRLRFSFLRAWASALRTRAEHNTHSCGHKSGLTAPAPPSRETSGAGFMPCTMRRCVQPRRPRLSQRVLPRTSHPSGRTHVGQCGTHCARRAGILHASAPENPPTKTAGLPRDEVSSLRSGTTKEVLAMALL